MTWTLLALTLLCLTFLYFRGLFLVDMVAYTASKAWHEAKLEVEGEPIETNVHHHHWSGDDEFEPETGAMDLPN